VRFAAFEDETTEATSVVQEIAARIASGEVPAGNIAILFRTNEQPRLFETELRRLRVRYILIGGQSFYDRREIRDMLAYLKVLARPDDEMSLLRIVNTPQRGIGDATMEKLMTRAVRAKKSIWDVIPDAQAAGEIPAKAFTALEELHAILDRHRRGFEDPSASLPELYDRLIAEIDYPAEIDRVHKEPEQRLARMGALEQLRDAIRTYAERAASPSLAGFLDDSALLGRDEEPDSEETLSTDAVKLMTLHSAKGLEFPRVYLVGLEEGLLPHRRSLEDAEESIAEERRLAYVGVTRAMTDLTVSWAGSRMKWGKRRPSIVSRFVQEMRHDGDEEAAGEAS
jgi:DNA helicase-2/ATP-dependent DNA helicase PcrA